MVKTRGGRWAAGVLLAAACIAPALAQVAAFPAKPIRLIVGFPPGTATDTVARQLADQLAQQAGWTFVVENKVGQAGSVAAAEVARAAPDGHTLLLSANGPLATNPNLYANVRYDTLRDFTPIAPLVVLSYVLVVPANSPHRTVAELLTAARADPGKLNYSSPGSGSTGHLIGASFAQQTAARFTHVPYKGSSESLTGMLSGSIDMLFETSVVTVPLVRGGKLRPLAVTAGKRIGLLPDVPTLKEADVPLEMTAWLGVVAPAGLPADLTARLNAEITRALEQPAFRQRLAELGAEVDTGTPDAFRAFLTSELAKWGRAVRESGARVE